MSDLGLEEFVSSARLHFEEGLISAGLAETDEGWVGSIEHRSGPSSVRIVLPPKFPFVPPRVVPLDIDWAEWSWHRERDGALCLIAQDDHTDLWWIDTESFLSHIEEWFVQADMGWPEDRPDLDLERYFGSSSDRRLVIYGDLDEHVGVFVRLRSRSNGVLELVGPGSRPANARRTSRDRWAIVVDLGELQRPPLSWSDLRDLIEPEAARRIERGAVDTVIARYDRGDRMGAAVLEVVLGASGLELRRLHSGPATPASVRARSGRSAEQLQSKHVAVLGVGAIGSFLVDQLVRSGVGRFTLIDDDVVKPGNLARHLVGPDGVGLSKTLAVRNELVRRFRVDPRAIELVDADACDPALIQRLLRDCDLVINATADFSVTALVHSAASSAGKHALSVGVQNGGRTLRIDVLPPISGSPLPDSSRSDDDDPEYFEAGCGSPVSPTPPAAVIESAAVACRHAVGILTNDPLHSAGEVRDMSERQL